MSESKYLQSYISGESSDWTDGAATGSPDDSCATNSKSGGQGVYNFSGDLFAIPGGSQIDGIEATVTRAVTDTDDTYNIELQDSTLTYRLKAGTNYNESCANAADEVHGGNTDDWGGTWTVSHVNSTDFKVRITHDASGKGNALLVDAVYVTVYYSVGGQDYEQDCYENFQLPDSSYTEWSIIRQYPENLQLDDYLLSYIQFLRIFFESLQLGDYIEGVIGYIIGRFEEFQLSDDLSPIVAYWRKILEATQLDDLVTRSINYIRSITEDFSIEDMVSSFKSVILSMYEDLQLSDTISTIRNFVRRFSEDASLTGILSTTVTYIRSIPTQIINLFDKVSPEIGGQALFKEIYESLLTDDFLSGIWSLYRKREGLILEDFTSMIRLITRFLHEAFELVDYWLTEIPQLLFKTLTESIGMLDTISRAMSSVRSFYEAITLKSDIIPQIAGAFVKKLKESFNLVDIFISSRSIMLEIFEGLNLSDLISSAMSYTKKLYESTVLATYLTFVKSIKRVYTEGMQLFERVSRGFFILLKDALSIEDTFNFFKATLVLMIETLMLSDTFSRTTTWIRRYTEPLVLHTYKWIGIQFRSVLTTITLISSGIRGLAIYNYRRIVKVIERRRKWRR